MSKINDERVKKLNASIDFTVTSMTKMLIFVQYIMNTVLSLL